MSVESAKLFIERMKTDKEFAQKVTDCKDTEARIAFVKAAGFDFTSDEAKKATGELNEEELDALSGGKGSSYSCYGDFV